MRGYFRNTIINENKLLQSYIVGLALGDGNLSNPNGRATRLRITCDKKYPHLAKRIAKSLRSLLPQNKISIVDRKENCIDISVYSNHLEKLLGWKSGEGSKFAQKVSVPRWIKENKEYKINCLKGLIETDGSIYFDRGYKTIMFSTVIPELANDVLEIMNSLEFKPKIYKIKRNSSNQKIIYNIKLSKNVSEFLSTINPEKN
jgi:DNA-binding transcriptional regulator WhiA